jgi:hypothetical protein
VISSNQAFALRFFRAINGYLYPRWELFDPTVWVR